MAFVKLFSSVTESSLWSESKDTRLLFITMLAKADGTGFVDASLPGLARLANLTISETEAALAVLESPDRYSNNPDMEGRRVVKIEGRGGWAIVNYDVYRNRRNDEHRRTYMRDYMANKRKQPVSNVNCLQSLPVSNVNTDVSNSKRCMTQEEEEAELEQEAAAPPEAASRFLDNLPVDENYAREGDGGGLGEEEGKKKNRRFVIPSVDDVRAYCTERNNAVNPEAFIDHYESNGWKVGKAAMKNWKAAVRTWERNDLQRGDVRKADEPPEKQFHTTYDIDHGEYNGSTGFVKNAKLCNKPGCEACADKRAKGLTK